jgi:hypothetical protein
MGYRKPVSKDFADRMKVANAGMAMTSTTSMGFTKWVNKDIRYVEETGDWSELLAKAEARTRYFRNVFYR